jgi:hypothetical protein
MTPILRQPTHATLVAIAALTLSAFSSGQDKSDTRVDLHATPQAGETVWFVESTASKWEEQRSDGIIKVNSVEHRTVAVHIRQVDTNGSRIIEVFLARIHGQTDSDRTTKFDSDHLDAQIRTTNTAQKRLKEVGRSVTVRIDKHGHLAGSKKAFGQKVEEAHSQLRHSDWKLAELGASAFCKLAEEPVRVTDSWNYEQPNPRNKRVTELVTASLDQLTRDTFRISQTGTLKRVRVELPPKAPNKPAGISDSFNRMMNELKLRGPKLAASQTVSRRDGLVIESQSTTSWTSGTDKNPAQTKNSYTTKLWRTAKPDCRALRDLAPANIAAAKLAKSQADVDLIAKAVRSYFVDEMKLPDQLTLLSRYSKVRPRKLQVLPEDAWGNDYKLILGEKAGSFHIASAGPDEVHGTCDDVLSNRAPR